MIEKLIIPRRTFIKAAGLGLASSFFLPKVVFGKASAKSIGEKQLNLYNIHTGESFNDVFWAEGQIIPENIRLLNKFMRDWRSKKQTEMCPELFHLLHDMTQKIGTTNSINIISAYRSKDTNDKLRKMNKGVAKHSKHLDGHAVDFNIKGVRLHQLRDCALSFKVGGVGYYPKSGFIHADIRDKPVLWKQQSTKSK